MKIYTHITFEWSGDKLVPVDSTWYEYNGPVESCCGATSQQKGLLTSQTNFYNTLQQQMSTVFGNSSSVFQDLMNTYAPVVAGGPSQHGFSPSELASLNSQAITQTGQAYQHAKEAVGEQTAAFGGGNNYLPSGYQGNLQTQLANSAASQTSNELNQINQADWQTGRQNWMFAAQGLAGAPSVFNPATGFAGAANQAGEAASNTANQIAQENNSWVNALVGAGAGIAGGALQGWISKSGNDNGGNNNS